MKKLTAFFTAITMMTLVSCSSKTSDTAVSEPVDELPTKPVFMEYNPEDFKEIDVQLNKQKDEPPINISNYKLNIERKEKFSPCKLEHEVVPFDPETDLPEFVAGMPESDIERYIDEMKKEKEAEKNRLENSCRGFISCNNLCGDNFYFVMNYDDICGCTSHCFDIYEYNIKTGEQRLMFSYEDPSVSYTVNNLKYIHGNLYICGIKEGYDYYSDLIYRLNEETNTLEEITDEHMKDDFHYAWVNNECDDALQIVCFKYLNDEWSDLNPVVFEYDFESSSWNEIDCGAEFPFFFGDEIIKSEKEDKCLVCNLDGKFRLNTGLRGAELGAVSENRVTVLVRDSLSTILYTYDFEKMERYKLDFTGTGNGNFYSMYHLGSNLYIDFSAHDIYLIPELGVTFTVDGMENIIYDGSRVWSTHGFEDYYLDDFVFKWSEAYDDIELSIAEE